MKFRIKALVAVLLFTATPTKAEEFIGFMIGPSYVNNDVGLRLGFGIETAGKLDPHWSLGFIVNYVGLGTNNGSADSANLLTFLGGVTYHGWENNLGPWFGLRGGVGVINNSNAINALQVVGGSHNAIALGVGLGYDKKMGDEWTWGPQGQADIVKTDNGNLIVFNALLTFRYWPQ